MLLLLCICLWWLWGAVPIAAQGEVSPSVVETTGPYRNLAENHAGSFHLRQEDGVVFATFRTDRSPVQFLARDRPEALLTVPEGFRPAVDITWEVSAQPVRTDGTPHPGQPDRRVFRMRVDTAGRVRYVDDAGVDGVGHLRYRTMLAWPLAGTEPRLCERHRNIRERVLEAVQTLEDSALPCSQVDWSHLARIRNLSLSLPVGPLDADFERLSLLGLTNLTTLQVQSWSGTDDATPLTRLLAHTPRLQTLRIDRNGWNLSANLLRYTPLLTQLSLAGGAQRDMVWPDDLLMHTPHLEALHLKSTHPATGLAQLLAHAPRLEVLTIMPSTPLPDTVLAAVPHLTHLTIGTDLEPCTTPQLLAPVPHLQHFAVRLPAEAEALACLADSLHRHAPILYRLEVELRDLQGLKAGVLPNLPRLTHLTLNVAGMAALPAHLLAQAPALTHLTLDGDALTLPAGFLAHTPYLTALSLQVDRLNDLPPDLLAPVTGLRQLHIDTHSMSLPAGFLDPVPHLTELRIDASRSTSLPTGFLDPVPQLIELRMKVGGQLDLPGDFLMHAPHLEVLHLNVGKQESLPAHFLAYVPRLVDLYLRMPLLQVLPTAFLIHAPRLEILELRAGEGIVGAYPKCDQHLFGPRQFPEHFLSHAPRLVKLHLRVPVLHALPPSFLGHAPLLETMELEYGRGYCFIIQYSDLRKIVLAIRALPANFLTHTPNLRHLNLGTGNVTEFPPDFLSHAPLLRHLNLDANGVSALPTDFLTRHPGLETVQLLANGISSLPHGFLSQSPNLVSLMLDLRQVEALPEHFLANTPRLHEVEIDIHRVQTLPPGVLAHAPHLKYLNLRAHSLTAWPPDLLAHAPRIQTLGLALPLLAPTLNPDHRLWPTLQNASYRVKVSRSDPIYSGGLSHRCRRPSVRLGSILEVEGREQADNGRLLLRVRNGQDREFLAIDVWPKCLFLIEARFTTPTLEVCEAFREPEACEPIPNRYTTVGDAGGVDADGGRG